MPETHKITYRRVNRSTGREGKLETGHFISYKAAKEFVDDLVRNHQVNEQPTIEKSKL